MTTSAKSSASSRCRVVLASFRLVLRVLQVVLSNPHGLLLMPNVSGCTMQGALFIKALPSYRPIREDERSEASRGWVTATTDRHLTRRRRRSSNPNRKQYLRPKRNRASDGPSIEFPCDEQRLQHHHPTTHLLQLNASRKRILFHLTTGQSSRKHPYSRESRIVTHRIHHGNWRPSGQPPRIHRHARHSQPGSHHLHGRKKRLCTLKPTHYHCRVDQPRTKR
ncbi:hypothetical protein B0O80DRAFT_60529 [Mortierella sp. GBAus27b]|nr:hypothetical protein B0O80DRAFT_60529 [Mortierella sp. GBAus27b]